MGSMLHEQHPTGPSSSNPDAYESQQKSIQIPQSAGLDGGNLARQPSGGDYFQSLTDYMKNKEGRVL